MIRFLFYTVCIFFTFKSYSQKPFDCTGQPFAFRLDTFYALQINSEQNEFIICDQEVVTFEKTNALAYRPTDNLIYYIENSKFNPSGPLVKEFYRLDADGNKEFIAEVFDNFQIKYTGAAISPDGKYFYAVGHSLITNRTDSISFIQIDLESSNFNISSFTLFPKTGTFLSLESLVCHPITGQIIAYDDYSNRLVTIDLMKQLVDNTSFPVLENIDFISGLYFDAFGTLIGIGRSPQSTEVSGANPSKYFRFDFQNGTATEFAFSNNVDDVCSCPNIVAFEQSISPSITFPCTEAIITYRLGNMSGEIQQNITMKQVLPPQSIILDIIHNPFGGDVGSSIGSNQLSITGITIPLGGDSIVVKVNLGALPVGDYDFQAELQGIVQPYRSGPVVLSDDARTCKLMDPTVLKIVPLFVDLANNQKYFCKDESILLESFISDAVSYVWNDGSTKSSLEVSSTGLYIVTVSTGCESYKDSIFVTEAKLEIGLEKDLQIDLGDNITLVPKVESTSTIPSFQWFILSDTLVPQPCPACPTYSVHPLENTTYAVVVSDEYGCTASDRIDVVVNKNYNLHTPNIFSPNGDNVNDLFFAWTKYPQHLLSLDIFDRWGNNLYSIENVSTNDPTIGWDGNLNGSLVPVGIYIWKISVEFTDGVIQTFYGNIIVSR